ncbi:MAG: PEP-CTERM sorting domain-containing protein, partial [Verrucomicrobiota bacterium]
LDILLNDSTSPDTKSYQTKFNNDAPATVTAGSSSATYGAGNGGPSGTVSGVDISIPVTDLGSGKGNWMFGNFNQNGVRDFSAFKTGVAAAKALETSGLGLNCLDATNINNRTTVDGANGAVIPAALKTGIANPTKGDLIVLGDYNGDSVFNGKDLVAMARGTTLADSASIDTLSGTFADSVRDSSKVLRKNSALDYLDANIGSSSALRTSAAVTFTSTTVPAGATLVSGTTYTYDSTGTNAFKKEDVNHDGLIDINDALAVDHVAGKNYTNLNDQLAATVKTFGVARSMNLVDAKLTDGSTVIDNSSAAGSDLSKVNTLLTGTGNSAWFSAQVKDGSGAITFARTGGTVAVNAGASLSITTGSLAVTGTADPFTDNTGGSTNGTHVAVSVGGGTSVAKLQLNGGVTLGTGEVDVAKNGVVVFTANTGEGVRQLIAGGKLTASTGGSSKTVGYLTGTQYNSAHAGNTLGLGSSDVIASFTWVGDTTLKGFVDSSDFAQLDACYLKHIYDVSGASWINGDFDHNGKLDSNDFTLLDAAYVAYHNLPLASDPFLASSAATLGLSVGDYTSLVAGQLSANAVPEPASLGLLALGAVALLRRRR